MVRTSLFLALLAAAAPLHATEDVQATAIAEDHELVTLTPGPAMTFAEALKAADERNFDLAAARLEIAKSEAELDRAWALIFPMAGGSIQFLHHDHEDKFEIGLDIPGTPPMDDMVFMRQRQVTGSLQAGVPVVNFQHWHTIGLARRGLRVTELTVANLRQQLLMRTAQSYFLTLMARSLIELNRSQVDSRQHHLEVATARFNSGTGLRIDVIRAETDLEEAKQALLTSGRAYDNARDSLAILTGTKGLPVPEGTSDLPRPDGEEDALVETALERREDLQARRAEVEMMRKALKLSWAQFLPTLDLGWQLNYQFTEPGELGSPDPSRWTAILTLTVPIYDQFRYADLDHKRASLEQATINEEASEWRASKEVRTARRDYLTALATVKTAERQSKLAHEAMTLADAAYRAGTGSSLEVTDARRTVAAADVNLLTGRLKAQVALLWLLRTVGENMLDLAK